MAQVLDLRRASPGKFLLASDAKHRFFSSLLETTVPAPEARLGPSPDINPMAAWACLGRELPCPALDKSS